MVYHDSDVNAFAQIFYKPDGNTARDQGRLNALIDPAVDRFKALDEEKQDEFKKTLTAYTRMYAFLAQIMPFYDVELEKLYTYGRFLLTKLPKSDYTERLKLDNEVAMVYYRLEKIAEGDLVLEIQGEGVLNPTTEAGLSKAKESKDKLSNIINLLNDRFGTDFTPGDQLFFDQIEDDLYQDDGLKQSAAVNAFDNFKYAVDEPFTTKLIERMEANQEIFDRIMTDETFKNDVFNYLAGRIYERFNEPSSEQPNE